jgi:hypothetical protein
VKEVPLWNFQMSWNFSSISIYPNHNPTQKFTLFHLAIWAQLQNPFSGPDLALQRKCVQILSKWPQILPAPSPSYPIPLWQRSSSSPSPSSPENSIQDPVQKLFWTPSTSPDPSWSI